MRAILTRSAPALLLAALASASPLAAQNFDEFVAVPRGTVALTNAKVIDGTGAPAMMNQTILIEGDRITAVGPSGSVRVPADANVVDTSLASPVVSWRSRASSPDERSSPE